MSAQINTWMRPVGIVLLFVGIVAFACTIFLASGEAHTLAVAVAGVIAGLGLTAILLSFPGKDGHGGAIRDLLSVFFTFGCLGPMIMLVITSGEANFLVGFVGLCVSGGISVLWAFAFIHRAYWMIPVAIIATAFVPPPVFRTLGSVGAFENFGGLTLRGRLGILGLESVASLVVGYVLMIRFVARVERQAARSEAELETAVRIHAQLVPPIERDLGAWAVRARSLPSSTMGGDLIDLIERPDSSADLVLADVTGHGVRAGVVMALVKGVVWAELTRETPLAESVERISGRLTELLDVGTFVTAVVARLPADADQLTEVIVAGHPPVIVRRADGTTDRIGTHGLPWGVEGGERYSSASVSVAPGDVLVLYSDGITEAASPEGPMLGIDGVEGEVARTSAPAGLVGRLLDAAAAHAAGAMNDDRSAAVAWVRAAEPRSD
ncbi:MAG: hypothetical protein DHS20C14_03190 [Phycisphaeraceae bacterium]|nr:MAG: hypothetical protein DHS20C14_03190 [Phycisphaeraceae bacterium]